MFDWKNKNVVVTGGASFIGSHLVEALFQRGCRYVRVLDNLSSGKLEHLKGVDAPFTNTGSRLEFSPVDITQLSLREMREQIKSAHVVFHLAADHGGRGYVDTQQAACATNLHMDGLVFRACAETGTEKVIFASSGCVYPNRMQSDVSERLYLTEQMVGPPYDADNVYGWAKLMGEKTLEAYAKDRGLNSVSLRYFTVYGPRGKVDHAVMAMLARAFVKQEPFEIWGDGSQIRNWTYIDDIVEGTLRAAEAGVRGEINLGTMERVQVGEAAKMICELAGYKPQFKLMLDMPTGPRNRVADNERAWQLLNWRPQVNFVEGIRRTWEWVQKSKTVEQVQEELQNGLLSR